MKKRILAMLLSALLAVNLNACSYGTNTDIEDSTEKLLDVYESYLNPVEQMCAPMNNLTSIGSSNSIDSIYTSPIWNKTDHGERHRYFLDNINQNKYDQWLKAELINNNFSQEELYKEYLILWKNELMFTIENGQKIFDGVSQYTPEQYSNWKSYLEQWMLSAESVLEREKQLLNHEGLPTIGVLISHCQLIRQEVINAKEFLYRLEFHVKAFETYEYRRVSIEWSPKADLLENGIIQNTEGLNNADEKLSNLTANDLMYCFYDNIRFQSQPSLYDNWLIQEMSKLHEEDPLVFSKMQGIYYDYLSFWEDHEFTFSIEKGATVFENSLEYNEWKNALEQLFATTKALSRCEFSILIEYNVNYFLPRCQIMRQIVLNTKFFLYYFEYQQNTVISIDSYEIQIEWSVKG